MRLVCLNKIDHSFIPRSEKFFHQHVQSKEKGFKDISTRNIRMLKRVVLLHNAIKNGTKIERMIFTQSLLVQNIYHKHSCLWYTLEFWNDFSDLSCYQIRHNTNICDTKIFQIFQDKCDWAWNKNFVPPLRFFYKY